MKFFSFVTLPRWRALTYNLGITGSLLLSFILVACPGQRSNQQSLTPEQAQLAEKEALVSRGRAVYSTNCTSCHHSDPKKQGALGPDLAGSSRELLDARIMTATYPANYKPKRDTHQMVAMPQLRNEIESLTAYLNSF